MFHNFHDVDVQMYLSWTHCHCSLWPSNFIFLLRGKLQQSAVTSWGYTHSSGIPYLYQTLLWCFTTFIWCGCVYVSVLTVLLLLSSAKLLESFLEIWSMGKPEHSVIVEAIDPFHSNGLQHQCQEHLRYGASLGGSLCNAYPHLSVIFWYLSTYDEWRWPDETATHNTNTYQTPPPWWWTHQPRLAVWIWWTHTAWGVDSLAHVSSKASIKVI